MLTDSQYDAALRDADGPDAVLSIVRAMGEGDTARAAGRWGALADRLDGYERLTGPQAQERTLAARVLLALGEVDNDRRDARREQVRSAVLGGPGAPRGGVRLEAGVADWLDGDAGTRGPAGVHGEARRTIDAAVRSGLLPDHAAERTTRLVEHGPARDRDTAARWVRVAGDPDYASAFHKLMGDPERGQLLWTERERAAFAAVQEFRAMSLTDASGGYMVPFQLDPSVLLTSAGSISALRQVARVVTIASDSWNGVSSAGVTASWRAEAAEMADNAPTLAQPAVPVHRGDAFVPYSFEVGQDAVNFTSEIARLLTDAADQLQTTAYTTGAGSGQPTGVVTAVAAAAGSVVNAAVAEQFTPADVYALQNAAAPRFQANARWMGNVAILNRVAQMETTAGARLFPEITGNPPSLLRKPVHELSTMDGTINPAATEANRVLLYGDFSQFLIVDRIGTVIEPVSHLFGANNRPTGQRGMILFFRTGSDVLVPNAFRLLNVATTA